jgi:hypothetical protein
MRHLDNLTSYIKHLPGFHTSRKIVVIESDDWGSIRMPSQEVFKQLEKHDFEMRKGATSRYNMYDSLATGKDLADLFEVLTSVQDSKGHYCIMTPMCLVSNPDFDKIRQNGFSEYYYEPFTETLKAYPGCESSFELWQEGILRQIFRPQFHGKEHLNITRWMKLLQNGDKDALFAFDLKMWGYPPKNQDYKPNKSLQAAFYYEEPNELELLKKVITEGLCLFESLFGYKASYFVPPNGPLSTKLEKTLSVHGIKFIQTARMIYWEPVGQSKTKTHLRYLGKKNRWGQGYMIRNCFFEPSEPVTFNWIDKCLKDIETAFKYKTPAIISSHRVNFIGALHKKNKENGLRQLKQLLHGIKNRWPDIEFMTSDNLAELIYKS